MQLCWLAANSIWLEAMVDIAILWHLWKSLNWPPKYFDNVPPFLIQSAGLQQPFGWASWWLWLRETP